MIIIPVTWDNKVCIYTFEQYKALYELISGRPFEPVMPTHTHRLWLVKKKKYNL